MSLDRSDDVLSAYLDGELADAERAAVAEALAADPELRAELAEVDEVRSLVRGLPSLPLPADLVPQLRARDAPVDLAAARRRRRGWARVTAGAAGLAAAAAIAVAVVVPTRTRSVPAVATDVRVHQAGTAAAGDPIAGLTPLASPIRFGR